MPKNDVVLIKNLIALERLDFNSLKNKTQIKTWVYLASTLHMIKKW